MGCCVWIGGSDVAGADISWLGAHAEVTSFGGCYSAVGTGRCVSTSGGGCSCDLTADGTACADPAAGCAWLSAEPYEALVFGEAYGAFVPTPYPDVDPSTGCKPAEAQWQCHSAGWADCADGSCGGDVESAWSQSGQGIAGIAGRLVVPARESHVVRHAKFLQQSAGAGGATVVGVGSHASISNAVYEGCNANFGGALYIGPERVPTEFECSNGGCKVGDDYHDRCEYGTDGQPTGSRRVQPADSAGNFPDEAFITGKQSGR
eukprot:COSAG04_NODE_8834_length_926_cov_1.291415_2_plen_261_part_01